MPLLYRVITQRYFELLAALLYKPGSIKVFVMLCTNVFWDFTLFASRQAVKFQKTLNLKRQVENHECRNFSHDLPYHCESSCICCGFVGSV